MPVRPHVGLFLGALLPVVPKWPDEEDGEEDQPEDQHVMVRLPVLGLIRPGRREVGELIAERAVVLFRAWPLVLDLRHLLQHAVALSAGQAGDVVLQLAPVGELGGPAGSEDHHVGV